MSRTRNQEKWDEVAALRRSGMTLKAIVHAVKMDMSSVRYVLRQLDMPYVPRPKPRATSQIPIPDDHGWDMRKGPRSKIREYLVARRAEWKRLYEEEYYSMTQIGKMFGKHHTIVIRELRKVGVVKRNQEQNKKRVRRTPLKKASPRLIDISTRRTPQPYEPGDPVVIDRCMEISLKIVRRGRGMLA